jgi:hypothetical protein
MITQEIINNSIEIKWRKKQRDFILKCSPFIIEIGCFLLAYKNNNL